MKTEKHELKYSFVEKQLQLEKNSIKIRAGLRQTVTSFRVSSLQYWNEKEAIFYKLVD